MSVNSGIGSSSGTGNNSAPGSRADGEPQRPASQGHLGHRQHSEPQVHDRAEQLTNAALMAGSFLARTPPPQRERAEHALICFAESGPGAGQAVAGALGRVLSERVGQAWQRGWEPVDVQRYAARNSLGARAARVPEQEVLRDAMAADLARYAGATVAPRWAAQMRELGVDTWWPASTDHLTARVQQVPAGWQQVAPAALFVIDMLRWLPQLRALGPLPGEADPATRAAAQRAQGVDERILSKVRALLAKAESTTYAAEAETFTAGAQAMMARHSIDAAMLDAAAGSEGGADGATPGAIRIGTDRPYESPKALLLARVASANRCRSVWFKDLGFATVVGFDPDLRAVEALFTSLLVQSSAAMQQQGSRRTAWGRSRTRSFRHSFLMSYATRIGERLSEVTRAEEHRARLTGGDGGRSSATEVVHSPGTEVVPVLAARSAAVAEAMAAMFPDSVSRRASAPGDVEGWHQGRAAADQARLSGLASLPARPA